MSGVISGKLQNSSEIHQEPPFRPHEYDREGGFVQPWKMV